MVDACFNFDDEYDTLVLRARLDGMGGTPHDFVVCIFRRSGAIFLEVGRRSKVVVYSATDADEEISRETRRSHRDGSLARCGVSRLFDSRSTHVSVHRDCGFDDYVWHRVRSDVNAGDSGDATAMVASRSVRSKSSRFARPQARRLSEGAHFERQ